MSRFFISAIVVASLATYACDVPSPMEPPSPPAYGQGPADGNGNKFVFTFDFTDLVSCGAVTITRRIEGWLQVRLLGGAGNRNVEIDIFKSTATFTNAAGETYVFRGVDAGRYWVENGQLFVALHGRIPLVDLGNLFIGNLILNLTTGEVVFQQGQVDDLPRITACEALT